MLFPLLAFGVMAATPPSLPIVFVRNHDIWVGGFGRKASRVVKDGEIPTWSPSRDAIAFVRKKAVMVVRPDGTHLQVAFHPAKDEKVVAMSWGPRGYIERVSPPRPWPSGTSLLLTVDREDGTGHVHIPMKSGIAGRPENLGLAREVMSINPSYGPAAWAGDGKSILYSVNGDLWKATVEWSGSDLNAGASGWDNHRVAAVAEYDGPTYRLDRSNVYAWKLSMSKTGRFAAYEMIEGGHPIHDTYWIDLKANAKPRLVCSLGREPSISPDGQWVLCSVFRADRFQLIAVDRRGKHETLLGDGEQGQW